MALAATCHIYHNDMARVKSGVGAGCREPQGRARGVGDSPGVGEPGRFSRRPQRLALQGIEPYDPGASTRSYPVRWREQPGRRHWLRRDTDRHCDAVFAPRRASPIHRARGCRLWKLACPDPIPDSYVASVGIRAARDAIRSAPGGSVRVELRLCRSWTLRRLLARRSERARREGVA